ncbi:MAG: carboxypeptidase regulatory-like domain-containing protein [Gammaproteobacteria bacterium]|nr:carboxypeptidase regulatory-like domain-containing protein [Gammaproteobacteria bacterium]
MAVLQLVEFDWTLKGVSMIVTEYFGAKFRWDASIAIVRVCLVCISVMLTGFSTLAAATLGELRITLIDKDTRRPVEQVTVVVTPNEGDSEQRVTDEDGAVRLEGLAPGLYSVRVDHAGYIKAEETRVRVSPRRTTSIELELIPGDEDMEEVVIVASAARADTTGSVSANYFDREWLRSNIGSGSDVLKALDGAPGLASLGEFSDFSVRGRGPRDNLILVDELPYDRVVHFDQTLGETEDIGGGGRFSVFAPNLIGGAEFSPGGWSAAYGGRAGSLLKLEVAEGGASPSAYLQLDIAGYDVGYEGPSGLHDDTAILISARRLDLGAMFEMIDELDIGDPVMTDIVLKTVTRPSPRNIIEFLALSTPERYTRDVRHVLKSPEFQDVTLYWTEQDSMLIGLTWHWLVGDTGEWSNSFFLRSNDKKSQEGEAYPDTVPLGTSAADIPVRRAVMTVDEKETKRGWRSDYTTLNRWGNFRAGARVSNTELDYSTHLVDDWVRFEYDQNDFRADPGQYYVVLTPSGIDASLRGDAVSYATYAEQVFQSGDWQFRAGARYDYDGFSGENLVSPRFAVNWHLPPRLRLSITAGTYHQAPRQLDVAADRENANLRNEQIGHVGVGLAVWLNPVWNLITEAYYQRLDNLVVIGDSTDFIATNQGKGTSSGADFVLNRRFSNGLSGVATYSYNVSRRDDGDETGEYNADFHRPHVFTASVQWQISDRWKVGTRWKYLSGRPEDVFVIHADVLGSAGPLRYSKETTSQNAKRRGGLSLINVRADYRRSFGPVDVVAFADLVNVTSANTSEESEFNIGRGTIVEDTGELQPLLGLRFERSW